MWNTITQHIDALHNSFIHHLKVIDVGVPTLALHLETCFHAEFDIGDLFLSAYLIGTEIGTLAGGGRCGELTSRGYAACGIGAFKQRRVWRACAVAPARDDVQQRIITQPVVQTNGPADRKSTRLNSSH